MTMGASPSDFAARRITPKIAAEADLILTMTEAHRDAVFETAPRKFRRTFTLTEASTLVSEHGAGTIEEIAQLRGLLGPTRLVDVADPIGRDANFFDVVGSQIADLLTPVLRTLCTDVNPPGEKRFG
jgi:protein-tyrosine phosphatase